jgi:hypothetical protein
MTTTSIDQQAQHRHALPLVEDRRRARALRWLLNLARTHSLSMPNRIQYSQFECLGRTYRTLTLGLDDETDLAGWAAAVDATERQDLDVTGDGRTWTLRTAETRLREGARVDWHYITVSVHSNIRLLTGEPAVTA